MLVAAGRRALGLGISEELSEALRRTLSTSSRGRRPRPAPAASARHQALAAPPPPPSQQQPHEQQPEQQEQKGQLVAAKEEWVEVVHQPTGLPYYWNQQTGETTAIGEPRPGPEGRLTAYRRATVQPRAVRGGSGGLGQLVAMGAGVGLVFALLSRIF